MDFAVAPDSELQPVRECVHDGNANAVKTARDLIAVLIKLPARMELGHDHFSRRDAFFFVDRDRNTASIVAHGNRPVGMQLNFHLVGVTGQALIDRIVDDLIDHVVQARSVIRIANIHAGTLANRVEALEDFDRVSAIFGRFRDGDGRVGHKQRISCFPTLTCRDSIRELHGRMWIGSRRSN